jgi:hypothetical protein
MSIVFAVLIVIFAGAQIALARDEVPKLNIEPTCHAAAMAQAAPDRHEDVCKRDELQARDKLQQEWVQFTGSQRERCISLSTLGGSPSYVELLTCLEMAKATADKPMTGAPPTDPVR